jgi:hypothetical protein
MNEEFLKLNTKSSEEDILKFLDSISTKESKYSDTYLKYCTSILDFKHQQTLFENQNSFNINVLNENKKLTKWTKWLVITNSVLAITSIISVFFIWFYKIK